jgi:uncharacterized protein (TIGR00106 family)
MVGNRANASGNRSHGCVRHTRARTDQVHMGVTAMAYCAFAYRRCENMNRHNRSMQVIADLCVVPIGIGVSVSKEIAVCEKILQAAGLKTQLHAYGTNIEGDWDMVFAAVKQCHEALHAAGVPRISTNMRFGTRIDREQTMEDKVQSVERKLIG